jgi:lysyl-tRNA synthetase class 2
MADNALSFDRLKMPVLADCVNMVFSLQRFRREKPSAPFELGGIFHRAGGVCTLSDALGTVELQGDAAELKKLNPGDLVAVRVTQASEFSVFCDKVIRHHKGMGFGAPGISTHIARFPIFVQRVREFFIERGLHEVLTPSLVRCPGLEPTLEPFSVELTLGKRRTTAYLPTSPEISLKKAMALGWTDIFEIKSCYRNGEFTTHHASEFLMLEWYRAFDNLALIEEDLRVLLNVLAKEGWVKDGALVKVENTDFAAIFKLLFDYTLTPRTTREELEQLCKELSIHHIPGDNFNDLFHRIIIDRIEPFLAKKGPTIVRGFPPSMAALAKFDSQGWADRFEFYWKGLEIANAFNEVTDPDEQMQRWQIEMKERRRIGTSTVPHDPDLINALKLGLPPSGGIALGIERLYMACAWVEEIRDLRLFAERDLFS